MSQTQARTIRARRADRGCDAELEALPRRTTRELREHWQRLIGTPPPGGLSRDLLMRVVADKLQEAALGDLLPAAKRLLVALVQFPIEAGRVFRDEAGHRSDLKAATIPN